MEFKTIKLKDVLKQYRIEHRVLDHHMYKQVTISKHLGVCYRGEKIGAEIGRKRQFLIDLDKYPNTFMLVRQGVQDGSFGFAPVEVNKCIVTENMPMFSVVDIDRRYLELYLKSTIFRDALSKIKTSGSAQKSIHERQILELSITIPSKFSDQKRIVEKLENVKSANFGISSEITNQLNIIGKFRQAFLREAMQGKLVSNETSDGKTGAELLQEIQAEKEKLIKEQKIKKSKPLPPISEDEIPFEIPENWVWCRMGEISYITSGSTPSSDSFVSTGIPYFKMYNIKSQKIDFWHKPQYIKKEIHEGSLKRCRLFPGDVLMNIVGPPLGKLAIIPEEFPEANFNQAAVLIRSFKIEINQFIFWYLNEMSAINEIDTKGVAGQANISVTQAHNIKFPLPPYEVQKRIVSKLDVLMKYCDNLEKSVKESQNYNDQLLQQVLREALEGKDEVENENLQLVAEESPIYSIQNTINKNCDTGDMAILAGYIIKKLSTQNSKDFGRVKLQKMLNLVEYHCQLSSELKYQKNVAGPYAWELEHVIEPKLKSLRFFEIKKDKFGATSKVTYTPLSASNELSSLFNREFKDQAESINNLLDKFQAKTWEFCEMISTMYAVWNNRLIRKELFTDDILKQDFLAWDDKKKRFIDQLDYALEWIRKEKIEPVGFGKYIDKK